MIEVQFEFEEFPYKEKILHGKMLIEAEIEEDELLYENDVVYERTVKLVTVELLELQDENEDDVFFHSSSPVIQKILDYYQEDIDQLILDSDEDDDNYDD